MVCRMCWAIWWTSSCCSTWYPSPCNRMIELLCRVLKLEGQRFNDCHLDSAGISTNLKD